MCAGPVLPPFGQPLQQQAGTVKATIGSWGDCIVPTKSYYDHTYGAKITLECLEISYIFIDLY